MSGPTATPIERDIVLVRGADAGDYLQTQLSQDVLGIGVGESEWSFLLTPRSEIIALMRVTRSDDGEFILDLEPGWGDTVRQTIDEFLFRMDVRFEQNSWPGIAWRGSMPDPVDVPIRAETPWEGVRGVDVIGPDVKIPDGVEVLSAAQLEQIRISAGWPSMRTEIDGAVTPAMIGLVGQAVDFDKGCYTGQEFVARVHYRAAAPTMRLIRLAFDSDSTVARGAVISVAGEEVGEVTSSATGVALGYLKRGQGTPASGHVGGVNVRLLATGQQ